MATGNNIIKDALQDIGVLAVGETPDSDMANHALNKLNRMIANWNNNGKIVYEVVDETQTITASTGTYTIGSGATWNTNRPTKIIELNVRDSNSYNYGVKPCSTQEWAAITDKTLTSTRPTKYYYDKTYPNGVINFWPVPSSSLTAVIYSWKQFSAFTLAGTVALPVGYEEAIILALGIRLCPAYGVTVSRDMRNQAWEALDLITSVNDKPGETQVDNALIGRRYSYDVNTDT